MRTIYEIYFAGVASYILSQKKRFNYQPGSTSINIIGPIVSVALNSIYIINPINISDSFEPDLN